MNDTNDSCIKQSGLANAIEQASAGDVLLAIAASQKTKRAALKIIDTAYWKLERCCESTHEWDRYVNG